MNTQLLNISRNDNLMNDDGSTLNRHATNNVYVENGVAYNNSRMSFLKHLLVVALFVALVYVLIKRRN